MGSLLSCGSRQEPGCDLVDVRLHHRHGCLLPVEMCSMSTVSPSKVLAARPLRSFMMAPTSMTSTVTSAFQVRYSSNCIFLWRHSLVFVIYQPVDSDEHRIDPLLTTKVQERPACSQVILLSPKYLYRSSSDIRSIRDIRDISSTG